LNELLPLLWLGMTAKAIAYLQEVPDSLIKDPGIMEKLMKYLERNTPVMRSEKNSVLEIRALLGKR